MNHSAPTSGWEDIVPILQDDIPQAAVAIAYDDKYKKLMNIFRGVVHINEKSLRVLRLTEKLLEINAANYTVWQYRRECLFANQDYDLNNELDYLDIFSDDNPKNYQIWHHRRTVVEAIGHGDREIVFCNKVFEIDAKNYHCWAHRQWAVKRFNLWDDEMSDIERFLHDDIRNNSAWNHRWFVIHTRPEKISLTTIMEEIEFTQTKLLSVHLNESAWNYFRGLYEKYCHNNNSFDTDSRDENNTNSNGSMKSVQVNKVHKMIIKFCQLMLQHDTTIVQSNTNANANNNNNSTEDDDDVSTEYEDIDEEEEEDVIVADEIVTVTVWNPFALALLADIKSKHRINTLPDLIEAKQYYDILAGNQISNNSSSSSNSNSNSSRSEINVQVNDISRQLLVDPLRVKYWRIRSQEIMIKIKQFTLLT